MPTTFDAKDAETTEEARSTADRSLSAHRTALLRWVALVELAEGRLPWELRSDFMRELAASRQILLG